MKDTLKRADLLLLLLYIAYCAAIILRVSAEGTGYTSPDSHYYLEAARSLRDGDKFIIRHLYGPEGELMYFAAWPIGYPILITVASFISSLNLFWASKLVNLFFAGLGFLILRQINRQYSFVLASIFGAFTIIEMFSYTWSEGPFIITCLWIVLCLYKYNQKQALYLHESVILVCSICVMFLLRYIAIFIFGIMAFYIIYLCRIKRHQLSRALMGVTFTSGIFVIGYLLLNYFLTGHGTGIARIHEDMETPPEVLWKTVKALTIELFLIRNYYLRGTPDILTVVTTLLQVAMIGYVWRILQKQYHIVLSSFKQNFLSHTALVVAVAYLIVLVLLRSISQFDPPNYRLLSPFTFLMLFAAVNYIVALPDSIAGAKKSKHIIAGFFVLSLLLNLPKKFLLSQFL